MNTEQIAAEIVRLEQEILNLRQPELIEKDALALFAVIHQHPDILPEEEVYRVHFIHSQALWLQGDNQPALDIALRILAWAQHSGNIPFLVRAYVHCGALYRNLGDFQQSEDSFITALEISNQSGYKDLLSAVMGGFGQLYKAMHLYEKAIEYLLYALELAELNGASRRAVSWSGILGLTYDDLGQYQQAIQYYKKAIEISEEHHYTGSIATWSGNVGVSYMNISDYVQALHYYQKALHINEEMGSTDSIAINIGNIGNVYFCLGEYESALEYFHRALALYEREEYLQGIADCTGNIGNVYVQIKEYERAVEYYNRNIAINKQIGYRHGIANNTGNLGSAYTQMGEFTAALEHLTAALTLHQEMGYKHSTALWFGAIGTVYAHQEFEGYDPARAAEYLLKALAICQEEGIRKDEYEFHKSLSELYRQMGQWQEFAEHYKSYRDIEHEVITTESRKQAAQMDYERKVAERDKQMAIERAETRARLDEQEKLILNILPHSIAERLLRKETLIVDQYEGVSILFMDLVNFTRIATLAPPKQLIYLLNTIFSTADTITRHHGLEKIKTIGDAYMAVAGAPREQHDHARRAAGAALDLLESINHLSITMPEELGDASWLTNIGALQVRIGLHCGPAIGGVIGDTKYTFDLWGDTVNTAARMESHGEPGKIHVSEEFLQELFMGRKERLMVNGEWLMEEANDSSSSTITPSPLTTNNSPSTITPSPLTTTPSPLTINNSPLTTNNSPSTINNLPLTIIPRGEMPIKGKGKMKTYFLEKA